MSCLLYPLAKIQMPSQRIETSTADSEPRPRDPAADHRAIAGGTWPKLRKVCGSGLVE